MKRFVLFLISYLALLSVYAQNSSVKEPKSSSNIIKKSNVTVDKEFAYRTFEVDVPKAGKYFLSAWVMGVQNEKKEFIKYDLIVNSQRQSYKIAPTKGLWQSVELKDNNKRCTQIQLSKGKNEIVFVSKLPNIAEVEFIKITQELYRVALNDSKYSDYIKKIKRQSSSGHIAKNRKDSIPSERYTNPEGNYEYRINVPFAYTTYKLYYFNSRQNVFVISHADDKFLHVLELFSKDKPEQYSWTVGGEDLNFLIVHIPRAGYYYLRVRTFLQNHSGLVDVNVNNQNYFEDCPVAGNGFRYEHTPKETLNYFTCHNTSDPRIWIESTHGLPGTIVAHNDDNSANASDFNWERNSRVRKKINKTVGAVLISAFGSYDPEGRCDLYMGCKNSNIIGNYFPYLRSADAIQSAPGTYVYNCTAWAGGITRGWFWGCLGPNQPSSCTEMYYGSPQVWSTWDDYFGNKPFRYSGAMTYTTDGANADNAWVAMWAKNGEITHGSVCAYANNHPHGYDWESKPGPGMRTFHPRDALNGDTYGQIVRYYKALEMRSNEEIYTFDQSLKDNLTVVEEVVLNDAQKRIVSSSKNRNSRANNLLDKWLSEIKLDKYKYISNPYVLMDVESGKQLTEYAKNHLQDFVILFADLIFDTNKDLAFEQNIAYFMFCKIAKDKYGNIIEQLKDNWKYNSYNERGSYIAPLPETFTKKYIKAILNKEYRLDKEELNRQKTNENVSVSIYPNPVISSTSNVNLVIDKRSNITVKILDMNNQVIEVLARNQILEKGSYSFKINTSLLKQGVSVCVVNVNGKDYIRKILKQ